MTALKLIFKLTYINEVMDRNHNFISKTLKTEKNEINAKIKEIELKNVGIPKEIYKLQEKHNKIDITIVDNAIINKRREQVGILKNRINQID